MKTVERVWNEQVAVCKSKQAFESFESAARSVKRTALSHKHHYLKYKRAVFAYQCHVCKYWHLTRQAYNGSVEIDIACYEENE